MREGDGLRGRLPVLQPLQDKPRQIPKDSAKFRSLERISWGEFASFSVNVRPVGLTSCLRTRFYAFGLPKFAFRTTWTRCSVTFGASLINSACDGDVPALLRGEGARNDAVVQ